MKAQSGDSLHYMATRRFRVRFQRDRAPTVHLHSMSLGSNYETGITVSRGALHGISVRDSVQLKYFMMGVGKHVQPVFGHSVFPQCDLLLERIHFIGLLKLIMALLLQR